MAEINLFGSYECTADAKGRVMLPGAVKNQLKPVMKQGFVIKQSIFSKSLELYPISSWGELSKQVNKLNKFVKKNVEFIRMFNFGVRAVELDDSARFLIPSDLVAFAGIKKDVVIVAQQDRMEIWDKRSYDKFIKENNARFEDLAQDVMGGVQADDPDGQK
jgi:MraZ protein